MELEERLLFEGLELEEPSRRVDEEILSHARWRVRIRGRKARARRALLAHAALGAALVVALLLLIPGNEGQPGTVKVARTKAAKTAATAVNEAPPNPLKDVRDLREEVRQIQEMTELIPDDLDEERKTIEKRIRICLADLQELEKKIIGIQDNSILYETARKEVNI